MLKINKQHSKPKPNEEEYEDDEQINELSTTINKAPSGPDCEKLYFLREDNKINKQNQPRATDEFLDRLLMVRSTEKTKQLYNDWAPNYEKVCFNSILTFNL